MGSLKRLQRRGAIVAAIATLLLGVSALPANAITVNAATSTCGGSHWLGVPAGVTADNKYTPRCYMNENRGTSSGVQNFQRSYNKCYSWRVSFQRYGKLAIDGDYGALTRAAVKRVQLHEDVYPDGSYGPVTGTHMLFTWTYPETGNDCERW